jgi:hypothetical protein
MSKYFYNYVYIKESQKRKKRIFTNSSSSLSSLSSEWQYVNLDGELPPNLENIRLVDENDNYIVYETGRAFSTSSISDSSSSSSHSSNSSSSNSSSSQSESNSSSLSSSSSSIDSSSTSVSSMSSLSSLSSNSSLSSLSSSSSSNSSSSTSSLNDNWKKEAIFFMIEDYGGRANNLNLSQRVYELKNNLETKYGFHSTLVTNSNVTVSGFVTTIQSIASTLTVNDSLVIFYGGHGTRIGDANGDESEQLDEALFLYDSYIIDDNIRTLIDSLPSGIKITVIFDTCYSGTGTREFNEFVDIVDIVTPVTSIPKIPKMIDQEQMRETFFASSADNQLSYGNMFGGLFTYGMARAIITLPNTSTAQEIFNRAKQETYTQTPQLEGSSINKSSRAFIP